MTRGATTATSPCRAGCRRWGRLFSRPSAILRSLPTLKAQAHLLFYAAGLPRLVANKCPKVERFGPRWLLIFHFAVIFLSRAAGVFVFLLFVLVWLNFLSSPWHCSVRRHATAHARFSWAKLRASTWKFFFSPLHRAHRLLSFSRNQVGAPMFSAFCVGPLLGCLSPLSLPWKRKKKVIPLPQNYKDF